MTRPCVTRKVARGSARRRGVTLVELLIAITILSILAGLILGVGAVAAETARKAQTKSTIARINSLLMDHYDTYRNRRVSLSDEAEDEANNGTGQLRGQLLAEARLHALREVMIMELPDRWSDVLFNAIPSNPRAYTVVDPLYASERTSLGRVFERRYNQVANSTNSITGDPNTRAEIQANESAECLFMIVMLATGDGEAPGLFSEKVIGDVDGDGANEFLDGWGNPIRYIRWAPGCDSNIQQMRLTMRRYRDDELKNGLSQAEADQAVVDAVRRDRDPFDTFQLMVLPTSEVSTVLSDATGDSLINRGRLFGYRTLPYVYSLGQDEESGIVHAVTRDDQAAESYAAWSPSVPITVASDPNDFELGGLRMTPFPNPYQVFLAGDVISVTDGQPSDAANRQNGEPYSDASTDNLSNHLNLTN